ncbi:hypothetical protein Nepgr_017823 [Nepenthes gracilis]|uniref:Auxin-responsive protein n=1 Tax=Nepenthes gracilis TaxID=150966 RepID=A0AAD3SRV4_NEPGR|nr:hypothetical protein Nepgr_017823 [Nepenthes gracilis]
MILPSFTRVYGSFRSLQGTENQSFCSRAQMVGWPPIRSFRKNTMVSTSTKHEEGTEDKSGLGCLYVKVSMDGAPYLRKVDLKAYSNYTDLSSALDDMFSCFTIGQYHSHGFSSCNGRCESFFSDLLHNSDHVLTYEDKDGDWMLVGDVPWKMFIVTCKRLRIVKGSEAIGLAPGAPEKSRTVDSFREFNGARRDILSSLICTSTVLSPGLCAFLFELFEFHGISPQCHIGGEPSQGYGLLVLGILAFLPGFYETRIAYYSWRGAKGYHFTSIPDCFCKRKKKKLQFPWHSKTSLAHINGAEEKIRLPLFFYMQSHSYW